MPKKTQGWERLFGDVKIRSKDPALDVKYRRDEWDRYDLEYFGLKNAN